MSKVIGIDLGTTNSVVAVMEGGEPAVIVNTEGSRLTPSVVGFTKEGERLVGQVAKRQAITNPENTVFSIKRFMGRRFDEVQDEVRRIPYQVKGGPDAMCRVAIRDKEYTPQEISAMILQKLKADAEAYVGEPIDKAVITVPAYFSDAQRQATKDAGRIAGLEVLRIINEPTASALAYGMDKDNKENATVLVFDLGGGTFDVSVLELGDGVYEVKATAGNNHLGGDDFDQRIIDHVATEFQRDNGIDLRKDRMALQRLKEAAEKAKIELSSVLQTSINLPFITADAQGPKHLDVSLTRAKFNELTASLVESTMGPCRQALDDAGLKAEQIDRILLVGGSTRIPAVQEAVRRLFGKDPYKGINPDEVVALGAAIQAGVLAGEVKDVLLLDVTPLSLGIETLGAVFTRVIERNTTIPTSKSQIFSTAADGQTQVEIHVLQGERRMAADNQTLGRFILDGIPPAPRGMPKIEVSFDIDVNGILTVSAKDTASGKSQKITIQGSGRLSEQEIQRMISEAEAHGEEDRRRAEAVEAKNSADALVYNAEKTLQELGDKAEADKASAVRAAVEETRQALATDDPDRIRSASQTLTQALYELSAAAYGQGSGTQEPGGESTGS